MKNIFAYGQLTSALLMEEVSRCVLYHEKAVLQGYAVYPVKGTEYQGIILEDNQQVKGILYHCVPQSAIRHLDAFNGENYVRDTVVVQSVKGEILEAQVFVFRQDCISMLDCPFPPLSMWQIAEDAAMHKGHPR